MSLFKNYEVIATVYPTQDDTTNDVTDYNSDTFTIKVNAIRLSEDDELILGETLGQVRANIRGINAGLVKRGMIIVLNTGEKYRVVNDPRYNKLFKRYKLDLKIIDGTVNAS